MSTRYQVNRRNFLRGMGVCLTLPALESLMPARALAAAKSEPLVATTATGAPLRTAFLYIPNGVNYDLWKPQGAGKDYQLNETHQVLAPLKEHFQIFSGFEHKNGWAGGDGPGDHARANATILTGARPKKTAGSDIRLGVSIDQVIAQHVKNETRFSSLELSCDGVRKSGSCDSGYSCAYQFNLSWRSETTPMAPESNPRHVFERFFGAGTGAEREKNYRERIARQRSVLDFIADDARKLSSSLGRNDQHKLDEYLTGVREMERRIELAEKPVELPESEFEIPAGVPADYAEHIRLMCDMLVLAFQTDSTRVATFLMAHDGSNRSFKEIGVSEGHHYLSHHQSDAEKLEKIARIDRFYADQFAYFLHKLQQTKDVDGRTLLDNSMIVYCAGLCDGNRHNHDNLPVILAGHGGGALTTGRHVDLGEKTPMTNLFVRMLDTLNVPVDQFGDSTGSLATI